jgi:hypothetical protein
MLSESLPWKRYWYRRGTEPLLDGDGFLADPEEKWVQYSRTSITHSTETFAEPCVIFLGEPSSGKSRAIGVDGSDRPKLEARIAHDGHVSAWLDLREYDTSQDISNALTGAVRSKNWAPDQKNKLYLFLDSLDECRESIPVIAQILIRNLRTLGADNVMFRLVCRTAEWPTFLESELRRFYRQEIQVLQLAPLRRRDIDCAAQVFGVQAPEFLNEITRLNAVPFARKPPTLIYLLQIAARGEALPATHWDLYEKGCIVGCQEYNDSRIAAHKTPKLTPEQHIKVASRIAALSILTDRPEIAYEPSLNAHRTVVTLEEIVGGEERVAGLSFIIDKNAVAEILDSPLFVATGPGTLRWETRNVAEFLAARYLTSHRFSSTNIIRLLVHPSTESQELVPQLHNTAVWLAERSDAVFRHVVRREADVLLAMDPAALTPQKKEMIVSELLAQAPQKALDLKFGSGSIYARLTFPGIAQSLHPVLKDSAVALESRIVAAEITLACRIPELADVGADLALDTGCSLRLRVLGALIVGELGDDSVQARLLALATSTALDAFEGDEMRGAVLRALWPQHLSFQQLLSLKAAPKEPRFTGLYSLFVRDEVADALPEDSLLSALHWVRDNTPGTELWEADKECMAKIFVKGLQKIAWLEVRSVVGKIAFDRLRTHEDLSPSISMEQGQLQTLLESDLEIRHALIEAILENAQDGDRDWVFLFSTRNRIIRSDDLEWILHLGQTTTSDIVRSCCWHIAPRLARYTAPDLDKLYAAAEHWRELKKASQFMLGPIDPESQLGKDFRLAHEMENKTQRHKKDEDQFPAALATVERFLGRGTVDDWVEVAYVLESTRANSDSQSRFVTISNTRGWTALSLTQRDRCLAAAKRYVCEGEPHNEHWFAGTSWPFGAVAGYQALVLVLLLEPSFIDALGPEIWKRWIPVLITFMREGTQIQANELVQRAYAANPKELLTRLGARAETEARETMYVSVVNNIDHIWDERIAAVLLQIVRISDLPVSAFRSLITHLLRRKYEPAFELALNFVQGHAGSKENREQAEAAAQALVEIGAAEAWPVIWDLFASDTGFGKRVVEQATYHSFGNTPLVSVLTETQLGQLFRWMLAQYPVTRDSGAAGAVSPQFTAERFRDTVLHKLIAYGTFEALEVLRALQADIPAFPWTYYLAQADVRAREATWHPLSPRDLMCLTARVDSRIVNTADDLVVILLEAIERIRQKLHAETPSVIELWNYTPGKERRYTPTDENDFSDWLKRRFEDEIVANGVIIGREVEIRRTIASRSGERTDLYVAATRPDSSEKIVVVVEVKGCWNRELKSALETQLVNRYLKDNLYTHGIYLVGWFSCEAWDKSDYRLGDVPFDSITSARTFFDDQARAASMGKIRVTPVVLDATLH